jgi:hypothetical protein
VAEKKPLRDPTLSPLEQLRLEQSSLESQLRQGEVRQTFWTWRSQRRTPPIERSIRLQGIISNAQGNSKAIVNGGMVGAGDKIGKVRVVRITPQAVYFSYRNRKFKRIISK